MTYMQTIMEHEDIGFDKGYAYGHAEGVEQGYEQKTKDFVLIMWKNNEPIEKIARYSKLTMEQVIGMLQMVQRYMGHMKDVEEIMITLFDQEYIWNLERDSISSEAFARGASEKQTQVVLNMFRRNMAVEDIADISGSSVEEVKEILKNAAVLH